MSKRPTECKAPGNVWFRTETMAVRNCQRKGDEWVQWRCFDHWHVKPKNWKRYNREHAQ